MYLTTIVATLIACFVGLLIYAKLDFGDPQWFLCLRVLLPILAMGVSILKAIKDSNKKE